MKKVLLFIFVTLFATSGFAQVKSSYSYKDVQKAVQTVRTTGLEEINYPVKESSIMSIDEVNIGNTYYDWQTNSGARNHIVTWDDGFINAVFTQASDDSYSDRGTGMATYDPATDVWTESVGRIEDARTGFGAIARYGENGLVVAAHKSTGICIWTTDDRTGNGTWVSHDLPSACPGAPMWASVMTSGANRDIIHVLGTPQDIEYQGQTDPVLYWRTSDGGETWDFEDFVIPLIGPDYYKGFSSNNACFMETTDDNRLAFIVTWGWSDGLCIFSDDNGDTWDKITFFEHPDPFSALGETVMYYPRWVSGAWDANNKLHITYEYNATTGDFASGSYYPTIGGVCYWNQDMPVMDTAYLSQNIHGTGWFYSDATGPMPPEYIGYLVPLDENGLPYDPYQATEFDFTLELDAHGTYNQGNVGMPSLVIDEETGYMYCIYMSITAGAYIDAVHYCRIYAVASTNGGANWTLPVILTKGFIHQYSECVYPAATRIVQDGKIRIIFQDDGVPGSYVIGDNPDTDPSDSFYTAMTIDAIEEIVGISDYEQMVEKIEMGVYPNPVKDFAVITLDTEAEVVIYNAIGQSVKSFNHKGGEMNVDLSELESGVYFVTANCGTAVNTQKIVVTK